MLFQHLPASHMLSRVISNFALSHLFGGAPVILLSISGLPLPVGRVNHPHFIFLPRYNE